MKQYNLVLSTLMVLLLSPSIIAHTRQDAYAEDYCFDEMTQTIKIDNKDFELFLANIITTARILNKEETLSHGLRACYKTLMDGKKEYSIKDMQEALPELLELANAYDEILKAPRPGNIPHNAIVGPGACDLSNVIQLLLKINNDLGICCSILQQDFQITWAILAHIESLLTVTAIDLSPIFTVINAGFNGTFSALDECCATINNEFQQTWTILATISSSLCNALSITAPTIIASPGYYCLANDIFNTLTITTDNVTVDLNNHTISAPGTIGINVSGATNAIIKNGKINNAESGLELNTTQTIVMSDLLITNCFNGIQLNGSNGTILRNIALDTTSFGILSNTVTDGMEWEQITISNSSTPVALSDCTNSIFSNCRITDCGSTLSTNAFSVLSGSNTKLSNCSIVNFQGNSGFLINTDNSIFENCTLQNIFNDAAASPCTGIISTGSNTELINCSVINVQSQTGSIGFSIQGLNTVLQNCFLQTCSSLSSFSSNHGFDIAQSEINLINCQAYSSSGYGFVVKTNGSALQTCESSYNAIDGFLFQALPTLVGNCTAFNNAGVGFNNVPGGTIQMYSCFASQNAVANYVNPTNVAAANVAGAFENSFI